MTFILCDMNVSLLQHIVTCHAKSILYNNRRHPAQLLVYGEAPLLFFEVNLLEKKATVTIWYPAPGLNHNSFLSSDETIKAEKHRQLIQKMHQKLR